MKSASLTIVPLLSFALAGCTTLDLSGLSATPEATGSFVRAETSPEAEARAAFVNVASVAQRRNVEAFKALVYAPDLPVFDANEAEHRGSYEALMTDISAHKIRDYRLDLADTTATFTADALPQPGDYSQKPATRVMLVRDGALWKIAAPPGIKPSVLASEEPAPARKPVARKVRRKTSSR